ncbi:tryptophan synthase subunit alpha [Flavobacterium sp. MAH-1]|uniref:Tryptophan synthase alpha chain n=1 Tax=Flavobacterium agri TaxID=2743471 RepID=A0A7Y8Y5B4_9FLAO|nr:tryptophan synthase subunit alpha [Flavobacterium agri]NUY82154.1 tryptophan synthase subunit alpha [Flavobacterium agri]NYA72178.1 tryptophan synthase subunit alpha [Flavobacterium agri]
MTRLSKLFNSDKKLLSVYFTAGFPAVGDTVKIITELEKNGVDFIEIGLPFSDPLADGPVIQHSSTAAIENGMTARLLFEQLSGIRTSVKIPLLIMGYFNSILQFGVENFVRKCAEVGINGLIIPDLPFEIYASDYRDIFEKYGLSMVFLVTPQTSDARIRQIDSLSTSFIYLVSSATITGNSSDFGKAQDDYFRRISNLKLKSPCVTGFGIHDKNTFTAATKFTSGAIVGSAFIRYLEKSSIDSIDRFVQQFH